MCRRDYGCLVTDLATPLSAWFADNARDLPWRRRECSAWGVMVSEFMLQQTPVARVIGPWTQWMTRWPTPDDLAGAAVADVLTQWGTLGYPRRALWLHRCATAIRDQHDGTVPRAVDELLALPGVGAYTARAIAVFAYGDRHPVVDTNTRRVLARCLAGQAQPGPASAQDLTLMDEVLPSDRRASVVVNAAAMELGAVVCKARNPSCDDCPLADRCAWHLAGHPDTGDTRPRQARYEGSDRQARGALLRLLREADSDEVANADLALAWPDVAQRDRAARTLIADGLAEATPTGLRLPSGSRT